MPDPLHGEAVWGQMRTMFETSPASLTQIAQSFGFKSRTSVARRAGKEGWKKDINKISTDMARMAVALDAEIGVAPNTSTESSSSQKQLTNDTGVSGATQADDMEAEATVNMTRLKIGVLREGTMIADRLKAIGLMIADRLEIILANEDQTAVAQARASLLGINPDRETLSGLVATMRATLTSAHDMKRKLAFGDDLGSMGPGVPNATNPMDLLMKNLPVDQLQALRKVALELSKMRKISQ